MSFRRKAMTGRKPDDIIRESFRIIEAEIGGHEFGATEWPVVRRMIHASGDLDIAQSVLFQNDPVQAGLDALAEGIPIVTDVRMVAAGINPEALRELTVGVHCFIDDPEVSRLARARDLTRSYCGMEKAANAVGEAIYVVGNAPTALFALCEAVRCGAARPRLILAMPVGFVDVLESKEQTLGLGLPTIAVRGRKGGSSMAAAAMNALLLLAVEGVSV
jgi:precorrin-8X/cobalt-precorrin-8 methylmutase